MLNDGNIPNTDRCRGAFLGEQVTWLLRSLDRLTDHRYIYPPPRYETRNPLCYNRDEVIFMEKEELKQLIDNLPENFSIEDLQYKLYVRSKIDKGLKDIEEGNVLSHDEVKTRIAQWLKK